MCHAAGLYFGIPLSDKTFLTRRKAVVRAPLAFVHNHCVENSETQCYEKGGI